MKNRNNDEEISIDFKKWIIDGKCEISHAACLICGIDPAECKTITGEFWHMRGLSTSEVEKVRFILSNAKEWHQDHLTIFDHVNTALKNSISINNELLAEITNYLANCIDNDREKIIKANPYLARELNISIPENIKQMYKEDITEKERPQVQKLILGMAEYCFGYKHGASKNIATGSNKGSIRAALQSVGFDLDEGTIKRYLEESYERHPIEKRHKS